MEQRRKPHVGRPEHSAGECLLQRTAPSLAIYTAPASIAELRRIQSTRLLQPPPPVPRHVHAPAPHPRPTHPPPTTPPQLLLTKVDDEDDVADTIAELVSVLPLKTLRQVEPVS